MPIDEFRKLVNSTIKRLQKEDFTVEECHKLSDNVTELVIKKQESEMLVRSCIFWIDIATRRCFIKNFKKHMITDQKPKLIDNEDIMLNKTNHMVQRKQIMYNTRFHNYGLFEIQQLGDFFLENGYID
jgi:hypothetical protein